MLTDVQETATLAEEPSSLAHEPQPVLPAATLSCTTTELFVPVAVQKQHC